MPITDEQFDKGKTVITKGLDEVMDAKMAYTTPEVSDLIGKSWGVAKNMLLEAIEEGYVHSRKIGRSIYFRYYPGGVPDELKAELASEEKEEEPEEEELEE